MILLALLGCRLKASLLWTGVWLVSFTSAVFASNLFDLIKMKRHLDHETDEEDEILEDTVTVVEKSEGKNKNEETSVFQSKVSNCVFRKMEFPWSFRCGT